MYNCTSVLPVLKEAYNGNYIELDFSQNLSLRPKDEVQSAHFSGKQFTLHCAIVEPVECREHYHISDDTKHDPFFVDFIIRDLIRTYGAAGHGTGAIDAMSSFGAKNILQNDIVIKDIFFNESIVSYLTSKKPQYFYTEVPALDFVLKRPPNIPHIPMTIDGCMKQHMMIFQANKDGLLKEYLCDCSSCLVLEFDKFQKAQTGDETTSDESNDHDCYVEKDTDNGGQDEQTFDFVDTPSYVTLITNGEPLHFFKLISKGVADNAINDKWSHSIPAGCRYFTGQYFKTVRSRNINQKKFDVIC